MTFTAPACKAWLLAHVITSLGWLGAVTAFFALAIVGLASTDAGLVTSSYRIMWTLTWTTILPLCLASLVIGIVQSLGTPWGLLRHYWVVFKLAISVLSTLILLLLHTQPIRMVSDLAAAGELTPGAHLPVRIQMIVASGLAIVAPLIATALSIYKPRGITPWTPQDPATPGSPRAGP